MKKLAAALVAVALVLVVAPAAQASSSGYSKKKQNQFWRVAQQVDPLVKYIGRKTTIELGIATCDLLRAGGTMYDLVYGLVETDMGAAEDVTIAIIATAPAVLCPDQQYKFD